jgi:hypothetical protein
MSPKMTATCRPLASSIVAPSDGSGSVKGPSFSRSIGTARRSVAAGTCAINARSGGFRMASAAARRINRSSPDNLPRPSLRPSRCLTGGPRFDRRPFCSRPEVRPIQRSVVHGFGDVVALDAFGGDEVGDRSGDFQDAVVGANGEAEVREGLVEDAARGGV